MKKLISIALVLCMCLATGAILASCEHQHEPSSAWDKDSTHHWHECAASGCNEDLEKAEHEYKIEQGDKDRHKKVCECGDTIWLDHKFDEGEVTVEPTAEQREGELVKTCRDCGFEKTEVIKYEPDTEVSASEFRDAINLVGVDNFSIKFVADKAFQYHDMAGEHYEFKGNAVKETISSTSDWYWTIEDGTAYQYYLKNNSYWVKGAEEDTEYRASFRFDVVSNLVRYFDYNSFNYMEEGGYYETVNEKTVFYRDIAGDQGTFVETFDTIRLFFEDGQLVKILFTRDGDSMAAIFEYGKVDFTLPEVE